MHFGDQIFDDKLAAVVIRLESGHLSQTDGVVDTSVKQELTGRKQFIRVADFEHLDRSFAILSYFKNPSLQITNAAVAAAGAFRKNNNISAAFKVDSDGFQAVQEQIGVAPAAAGGDVSGKFNNIPQNRYGKQPVFGDGGMPGIQGHQQNRIQVGDMVAYDDGGSNGTHLGMDIPFMPRDDQPAQTKKTSVKQAVKKLESALAPFDEKKGQQVEGGKKHNKTGCEIPP